MTHRRTSILVAAGALFCLGVGSVRAAELRVAVVDMQRALNECDAGKRAKDQVKAKFEKSQDDLKRQREDLDRRKEESERKAPVLKEEERRIRRQRPCDRHALRFAARQLARKRARASAHAQVIEQLGADAIVLEGMMLGKLRAWHHR